MIDADSQDGSRALKRWSAAVRRYGLPCLVALTGITLAGAAALLLLGAEGRARASRFTVAARDRINAIAHELDSAIRAVRSVEALFAASEQVEAGEFATFTGHILADQPQIDVLAWAPRGACGDRPRDDDCYPIRYVQPPAHQEALLGTDLGAGVAGAAALARSRNTGEPAATAPAPGAPEAGLPGMLLCLPTYDRTAASSPAQLTGFVAAGLSPERLVEVAMLRLTSQGIEVCLFDGGLDPALCLVHHEAHGRDRRRPAAETARGLVHEAEVEVAGRRWLVRCTATGAFPGGPAARSAAVAVFAAGALFSVIGAVYVLGLRNRHATVAELVSRRSGELAEFHRLLQAVLESVGEGIVVADPEGHFIHWNPAAEQLVGMTAVESGPEQWPAEYGVFLPDGVSPFPAQDLALTRAIAGESVDQQVQLLRNAHVPDGRWISASARPLKAEDGSNLGGVVVFRDITELREQANALERARQEAENANRAKSEFLATMSHELRTPLNGVIGMTDLLLGTDLDAQQRRHAWLAKTSGDALLRLINDILDFSKIEAGKIELETIDFNLQYVIESVASSMASTAHGKGLELLVRVHPDLTTDVRGDSGRVQQVLANLISNAIKFTEQGEIMVRAVRDAETDDSVTVRIGVSDTGIGIPSDRRGRLFESFSQIDASTTRRYGGTGLGLAICKRLVGLMGGEIGVESEEGRGSTFWFTVTFEKQAAGTARSGPEPGRLTGLRTLFVDDNATNREILHEQLTSLGIEHEGAPDAGRALSMLRDAARRKRPFAVAVLDMQMPQMDGLRLAEAIKADPLIRDTVLVLLTSTGECDPHRLRGAGIAGCLTKPVARSNLVACISEATACAAAAPSVDAGAAEPAGDAEGAAAAAAAGARILVAEDHEISQEVARSILAKAGYGCEIAGTGREAVEAVRDGRCDLVLMDCQMPEMDGFEATRAIRRWEADRGDGAPPIPIVALTANAVKGDRERCLDAGMNDYISKPLDAARLVSMIEAHLRSAGRAAAAADDSTGGPPREADGGGANAAPIDGRALLKLWDGDLEMIKRLLEKFRTQAAEELERLEQSLGDGDAERAARLAHGLKGAAGYLAAGEVRRLAAELEAAAGAAGAEVHLQQLRREIQRCLDYVPALLERLAAP